MPLATVFSRAQDGLAAPAVAVEVDLAAGLPALSLVGLPETAVKESKDRVRAAIVNSGFEFPNRKITVNLAPADLPKEGGRFDLAIALGVLAASGQVNAVRLAECEFLGELSLSGELRPVTGVLPAALHCRDARRTLIVPEVNGPESVLAQGVAARGAKTLLQVCAFLSEQEMLLQPEPPPPASRREVPDLSEVRGQHQAKRALEIAAAGGHSRLRLGPPGSGKSMLAARLPGLLPPLAETEALEVAMVQSVSRGGFDTAHWGLRPFRGPHHTSSAVALVGGGSVPRPGEITLAHHGVLFLDELPEFDRRVLEVLREPLETGHISISRAARQMEFPARFQLVAAMNPCPCGFLGDASGKCRCTSEQVQRYAGRISGPLLDRIDLHVGVARVDKKALTDTAAPNGPTSGEVQTRAAAARRRQLERAGKSNAALTPKEVERYAAPTPAARSVLEQALERLGLSARGYHRVLKVARTIADLAGLEALDVPQVSEAISYRQLDRTLA